MTTLLDTVNVSRDDLRRRLSAPGSEPSWAASAELTDAELLAGMRTLDWSSPYDLRGKLDYHALLLTSATFRSARALRVHVGMRRTLRTDRPVFTAFRSWRPVGITGDEAWQRHGRELRCADHLQPVLDRANAQIAALTHLGHGSDGPTVLTRSAFLAAFAQHPRS